MSCFALLKKGDQYMAIETVDPSGLAASLAFQLDAWVQVAATFPNKSLCPDELGFPYKQWVDGDEIDLIKKMAGAISVLPPYAWDNDDGLPDPEPVVDIFAVLEPCSREDADTASICKQALYERYAKGKVRPVLREQTEEKTTTVQGFYKKVLKDMQSNCLRVKR